jgi:hypothetical protein
MVRDEILFVLQWAALAVTYIQMVKHKSAEQSAA